MVRLIYIAVLVCFSTFILAQNTGDTVNVSGSVKIIHSWCTDIVGGEKYEEAIKPRPFPYKKLYVRKGDSNDYSKPIIMEFTTDKNGNFSISLPPGVYCIVDESKIDKAMYDTLWARHLKGTYACLPLDTNCFKKWFATPEKVFKVGMDSVKDITLTFYTRCSCDCDIPCARNRHQRR